MQQPVGNVEGLADYFRVMQVPFRCYKAQDGL